MPTLSPVTVREASLVNCALSCAASADSGSKKVVVPGGFVYLSTYARLASSRPSARMICLPVPEKGSASGPASKASSSACSSGVKIVVVAFCSGNLTLGKSSVVAASCLAFFFFCLASKASISACSSGVNSM